MNWSIQTIRLDLKYTWAISRNATIFKENLIITCEDKGFTGQGEVAPNIRYHETPQSCLEAFELCKALLTDFDDPTQVDEWLMQSGLPNALRFGIESAYLHLYCQKNKLTLCNYLGIEHPGAVATCYTLPIMEPSAVPEFYHAHGLKRFAHLKVKVNDADAIAMIHALPLEKTQRLMIDANEAWKDVDALLRFQEKLNGMPVDFIEQPMPANMEEEYRYLHHTSRYPILADESVLDRPNFEQLKHQFHGVNMKLMKAGGYLNGLRILKEARKNNMFTMVGCMVETTLGIKGAWTLAPLTNYSDLDGCLIIENEPFKLLEEREGNFYAT